MRVGIDVARHPSTLLNYVHWMRTLGYDARLTHYPSGYMIDSGGFPDYDIINSYSVDIAFVPGDSAAWIFVGFNIARFLIKEFSGDRDDLTGEMTAEQFISTLFNEVPHNTNHMPFVDIMDRVVPRPWDTTPYGMRQYDMQYVHSSKVKWSASLGAHLYIYLVRKITGPRWNKVTMAGSDRPSSNLCFDEFYNSWLSSCSIIDTEKIEKGTEHAKANAGNRSRDSRGRYRSVKAQEPRA